MVPLVLKDNYIFKLVFLVVLITISACKENAIVNNFIPPKPVEVTKQNGGELLALVDTKGNQLVDKETETYNIVYSHNSLETRTSIISGNQKSLFGDANPLDYLDDQGERPTGIINYLNEESNQQILLASIYKLDTVDFFAGASNYITYALLYDVIPDKEWNHVKSIISFLPGVDTDHKILNDYNFNAKYFGQAISHITPIKNVARLKNKEVIRGSVVIDVKLRSAEKDKISGYIDFIEAANKLGWLDVKWDNMELSENKLGEQTYLRYAAKLYEKTINSNSPIGKIELYFFGSTGEEIGGVWFIDRGLQYFDLIGALSARRY